jgi:hypothetical protein
MFLADHCFGARGLWLVLGQRNERRVRFAVAVKSDGGDDNGVLFFDMSLRSRVIQSMGLLQFDRHRRQ